MRPHLVHASLALLGAMLHANAPAVPAANVPTPAATVRADALARPALTRLDWGSVNLLVYADTTEGVHVWAAPTSRDPRMRVQERMRDFSGRFDPAEVERWADRVAAVIHAQRPVEGDTAAMFGAMLLERDSAVAGVLRRRDGDRLDPHVYLFFAPKSGQDPLVIRGEAKDALAFANTMLQASALSRVRPPASATAGGLYHDNPIDPVQCVASLRGPVPRYPENLQMAGVQGEVWALFVVDSTGRADPRSFEPLLSDHSAFTTSVRTYLRIARYRPATRNGRPVNARVAQRFVFNIGTPP